MSLWRQFARGVRALSNRTAADQDAGDEVQHYLDEATAALVANGLSLKEARRAAQLELGSVTAVREQMRSYGWENFLETLLADVRCAGRWLCKNPGFTVVSALTLALGIGASTAIFSAVNPILLQPLPYPHADRLMMIWDISEGERSDVTFHTYREVVERNRSFDALAVMDGSPWQPTMIGSMAPKRLDGQKVSASYFHVLGVSPALGRDFQAADDRFHGPRVVILSNALWKRRFGRDPWIIGRGVRLDDDLYTVLGVLPPGFENVLSPATEIWSPLQYDAGHATQFETREWGHHMRMFGRLRPGVGIGQARRELDRIAHTPIAEFPRPHWASLHSGFIVDSLQDHVTRAVRPALLALSGAVILVLLIACVNVTNLLLSRGTRRRGEFAMRAALGAGRPRLMRQLLTESLLLAALGGGLGILVANLGIWALAALSPPGLPRVSAIGLDGTAFAFAFGVTTLIGLVTGLIPALDASRIDLIAGIQQSSQRIVGGHQWARRMLVVSEVALAFVLLVSAGLLLGSLEHMFAITPGFNASHLLTMQVQLSGHRYDKDSAKQWFFARALEAVRGVPGAASVAVSSLLPFSGDQYGTYGVQFEDRRGYEVSRYVVSPGYFQTMGIPLRRGRPLSKHDTYDAPLAAVISESLAKSEFHGADPIGRRVHIGPLNRPEYTIVGVVGDVKQASLAESQPDAAYITPPQSWFADDTMSLIVRVHGNATAPAPAIKNAIWSLDKDQAIVHVATMDSLIAKSAAERRFAMIVFEAFALAALMLAAIGLYGVLAGSVNDRTREIGVRAALGASRGKILVDVVQQGMKIAGLGIVIGLGAAAAATQGIASLLFGVSRLDAITYLGVIALLAAVSLIACWVPAWRAARVDPSVTLRAE
ncbi:MAG TPA: ABC transporter permease [Bryobacteraceae bacterium]|nr:ABC transporter permease [Bryobacteraceae bacterium]